MYIRSSCVWARAGIRDSRHALGRGGGGGGGFLRSLWHCECQPQITLIRERICMIKRIRDFNQKNSLVWKCDTLGEARLIPGAPRVTARRRRIMNMHVRKARYHIKMGYCLFRCTATGGNRPPEGRACMFPITPCTDPYAHAGIGLPIHTFTPRLSSQTRF